jgi:hypothetical protein
MTTVATYTPADSPAKTTVALYPNPASGTSVKVLPKLYVGTSNVRVRVYSLSGRKVMDENFWNIPSGQAVDLLLKDHKGVFLSNGIYYLIVDTSEGSSKGKLLVLR